jgi:hypothetical protein
MGQALVVGVAVRQGDKGDLAAVQFVAEPAAGQARGGVDQHVADEVDVDQVGRKAGQLPHARKLPEEMRVKVRQALTERLTRLPSSALREKLAEEDAEIRRAAALACAKKEDRSLIPNLIELLDDGDVQVGRVVRSTLKTMTGQDYADPSAWQMWWSGQGGE